MIAIEPLTIDKHHQLKVDTSRLSELVDDMHLVDIVLSEISQVAKELPIFFIKDSQTGQFNLVALMGLKLDENLVVKQGRWQGQYVPLKLATQPLFYRFDNDETGQASIVINRADQRLQSKLGEPLFEAGQPSNYLTTTVTQLNQIASGYQGVDAFIDKLVASSLLEPVSLAITLNNEESIKLDGLYTLNQTQLAHVDLDDDYQFYSQQIIVSLAHVKRLINLKNQTIDCVE